MSNDRYVVSVRNLVEFTAKQGDLDFRFTPAPSAQEGIEGHQKVSQGRAENYQREIRLEGRFQSLLIQGRADGFDPDKKQLEEIKTYRGEFQAIAENHRQLHWAQAKVYAHLLCQKLSLHELNVALVYFHVDQEHETVLVETMQAQKLQEFFDQQCTIFLAWSEQEMQHRLHRDAELKRLVFPFPEFRSGQRELAQAMYKASARACCLLAQAPTGIGKTLGSLFPMLKACADHQLDKLFFLTAKTSGRALALGGLAKLGQSLPRTALRSLELVAKATACEFPENACHGESCPLAQGFYDRLPAARNAALTEPLLNRERLREIALAHQVCPFYLSTEMVKWCDVIVGDYNYYFDIYAMLHGLTQSYSWKLGLLIDEAHNMVARARSMYTAELRYAAFDELRANAPLVLKKSLDRVKRQWRKLEKENELKDSLETKYVVYEKIPEKFNQALTQLCTDMGAYFAEHATQSHPQLQEFYLHALLWLRLSDSFGDHSIVDLHRYRKGSTLCIRNIVPAPFLRPRFKLSHTSVLFSATLSPWYYYADLLGMPEDTAWVDVESPFREEQLRVHLVESISTRYAQRQRSLQPIADMMAQQFQTKPGAYLAFFSSFEYMDQVVRVFKEKYGEIEVWIQSKGMSEFDRDEFLGNFTEDSQGIGFAVLGGAFGEGIDLPGTRLIGAFIATLGLPQFNPINEQIKQRMQQLFGAGYDYTYLYPGIQKVVQAAGRVIRTTSDEGVVYLIDDRFGEAAVRALLPGWWGIGSTNGVDKQKRLISP